MDPAASEALRPRLEQARRSFGRRPANIEPVGPGEESVWDFPRPPRVERVAARLRVELGGLLVAETTRGVRIVETAGAPTYYFPPDHVSPGRLVAAEGSSLCEWKGVAAYWDVVAGERRAPRAAWSYPEPFDDLGQGYAALADWPAFMPTTLECFIDEERVTAQPGGFYGGWVTRNLRGPIKGGPGSAGW